MVREPGKLRRVARSLRRELFGFRAAYPVEAVPEASESRSLRYHVYSPVLFLDELEPDGEGVPRRVYRLLGPRYNPLFVAWWALHHFERSIREREEAHLETAMVAVRWLERNAERGPGDSAVWPCHFDWQEGRARLEAPWISAMYQGVVASALVRGHRHTGEGRLLDLALRATGVFRLGLDEGGVAVREQGGVLYEEYPARPLPRILDGFLFSLLGLWDLATETADADIRTLFDDGVRGLESSLGAWDYRGKWSWYGTHGYLCPPHYHNANQVLLDILARLSGSETLGARARAWDVRRLSALGRAEVFVVFALTKNLARLRLPNEAGGRRLAGSGEEPPRGRDDSHDERSASG